MARPHEIYHQTEHGAPLVVLLGRALVFDTTSPKARRPHDGRQGGTTCENRLAAQTAEWLLPRHGNFTPTRFSGGRPHCVWLWLDGSIIVPDAVVAKQPAMSCFPGEWMTLAPLGLRRPAGYPAGAPRPLWPPFAAGLALRRWSSRIPRRRCPFRGTSVKVSVLPDIQLSSF